MEALETKLISFEGNQVAYYSSGQGQEALVFIHGWTCASSLWKTQEPLYRKFRSLLIDLPGHGGSDAPRLKYTQEHFARAIEAVLQAEKVEKAVLIGHSMGGPVSTMTLRLFPHLVSAVVYVDSFWKLPETYLTEAELRDRKKQLDEKFRELIPMFFSSATPPENKDQVEQVMVKTPLHVRLSAVTDDCRPHAVRWNEIFHIPALHIMWPKLALKVMDWSWLHHVPNLKMDVWDDDCGHFPFMDQPERFNKTVEQFLAQNRLLGAGL